jgi:glucose-6-phosphate 1-dehydrogenase
MIPNHLVQLLALTAMEPPSSFSAAALQNEQVKVLESAPPINPDECAACVIRGQYTEGTVGESVVAGYREEPYVDANSQTETYVALKIAVDNWRWAGVPFYLRTGKRMRTRNTHIMVQFRNAPLALFRRSGASSPRPNLLVRDIQRRSTSASNSKARFRVRSSKPSPSIWNSTTAITSAWRIARAMRRCCTMR